MTKQKYTFDILGGYLMSDNTVNAEYLAHCIYIVCINDKVSYDIMLSHKNRKNGIDFTIKYWICHFINTELKHDDYYHGHTCTYAQVKNFNKLHDNSLDKVYEILRKDIENEYDELSNY